MSEVRRLLGNQDRDCTYGIRRKYSKSLERRPFRMAPLLIQITDPRRRRPRGLAVAPLQQMQQLPLLISVGHPAAARKHPHTHLIPRRHLARAEAQPDQCSEMPDHFVILQALQVAPEAQPHTETGGFVREQQHLSSMVVLPPDDVPDLRVVDLGEVIPARGVAVLDEDGCEPGRFLQAPFACVALQAFPVGERRGCLLVFPWTEAEHDWLRGEPDGPVGPFAAAGFARVEVDFNVAGPEICFQGTLMAEGGVDVFADEEPEDGFEEASSVGA